MKATESLFILLIAVSVVLLVASGVKLIYHPDKPGSIKSTERPLTNVLLIGDLQDIGAVPQDSVVTQQVSIINNGPEKLYVEFVNPDCNCTGYRLSPSDSASIGDTLFLYLTIDMNKKKVGRFMLNTVVGMNTESHLHRIAINGEVINNTK